MVVVLLAALLHAGWNHQVKSASDKALSMTAEVLRHAPFALVAALRETSIIFALLLGVGVLKEHLDLMKIFATACTLLGVWLLRSQR